MMKKSILACLMGMASLCAGATDLFFYSPENGDGGLRLAVKEEDGSWRKIGNGYDFVRSDFGPWGSHKKMWNPELFKNDKGNWVLLFRATDKGDVVGMAESPDLMNWRPQKYYLPSDTAALAFRSRVNFIPTTVAIDGHPVMGNLMKSDPQTVAGLDKYVAEHHRLGQLYSEHCDGDKERFANLKPLKASLTANGTSKEISPLLMGIFFEDINYAADGGLYGELIQNRDFEYDPTESGTEGWGPAYAWSVTGDKIDFSIATDDPIHPNNPHFARLDVKGGIATLVNNGGNAFINSGYDGIAVQKGEPYRLRFKARVNKKMPMEVALVSGSTGQKLAMAKLTLKSSRDWKDYEVVLTPNEHCANASLQIVPKNNGVLDMDMISLFPVNTFKGRENGLRADLAQSLADLKPRFVRFPGGCVAHGNGLDNMYDWKGSIGKLEERKPLYNLWGYHQTRGLGYHEYFQFCEDIGAEPLPVLAAAVPCQNSGRASHYSHDSLTTLGQQEGLPMDSLDSYIQDVLDLIEYANGSATSVWGKKRAEAGHPAPFNLKYIGIGNEDMITEVFEERFKKINAAVKKAHPEITVVGTVGPFYEGSDYTEGWCLAKEENVDMVDEHYYVDPAWLIYNQDYYDDYDRNGTKVYLGEWAAHLPGRPSNMETALAEALYLTSVERNGDVVSMSSYAPLLAKDNHTQWRPDLIYFSNTEVRPTTDYQTMRLYGENSGSQYLNANLNVNTDNDKAKARVGTSIVKDENTGDVIVKLVNLLPVETEMEVDLRKLYPQGQGVLQSVRTVMSGQPADSKPSLKTDRVSLDSPFFTLPLAPYSFTVLRIAK
ncbi:MAG: carbohydrate binding domain-containing protein [Muribaculaceae bacterium]|nr:carbohydrate binding domain-containing protein [Muribaculaceae bacterium]